MALPAVIEPCLPSPGEQPPTGPGWVHEIKHEWLSAHGTTRCPVGRDPVRTPARKAVDLLDRKAATVERGLVGNGYK